MTEERRASSPRTRTAVPLVVCLRANGQVGALERRGVRLQQLGPQVTWFSDGHASRALLPKEHEEVADATELTGAGNERKASQCRLKAPAMWR